MQNRQSEDNNYSGRLLTYLAREYGNQLKLGGNYKNLKNVTVLAVCGFSLFPKLKESVSRHVLMDNKTHTQCSKGLEIGIIDLVRFRADFKKANRDINSLTQKTSWGYCIDNFGDASEKELEQFIRRYPDMANVMKAATWTEEDTERVLRVRAEIHAIDAAIEAEERRKAIREKVRAESIAEGRTEGEAKMINLLLKGGMDIQNIAKCTGLPPQEIETLRAKL